MFSELLSTAVSVFAFREGEPFQPFVYSSFFQFIINPAFGSLVYSILFSAFCWIPVWLLFRKRIFLKL